VRPVPPSRSEPSTMTLHLRQVSYQPQERHGRRLDGAPCQSLGIKSRALHLECEAYAAQALDQRGALVAQRWSVLTRVVLEIDEHVGSSGRGHGRELWVFCPIRV